MKQQPGHRVEGSALPKRVRNANWQSDSLWCLMTGGDRSLINPSHLNQGISAEKIEISETPAKLIDDVCRALIELRERRPRVHCITNIVAAQFTANMLLALGAQPSMTMSPDEIGPFVESADALLVNLGTFNRERQEALVIAADVARENRKPWVLDPVLINRSPQRARYARGLLGLQPHIIRSNGAEYEALFQEPAELQSLIAQSQLTGAVLAVSGATDQISDGTHALICANGHPWLSSVTAIGCAQAAIMAAFAAITNDHLVAALGGLMMIGIAGEKAAETARGPGSFAVHLIDAIHALDGAAMKAAARLS